MEYTRISKDKSTEDIYGMTWLSQQETSLPMAIFVSPRMGAKHGPRVKVSKTYSHKANIHNTVNISIEDEPEIETGKGLKMKDLEIVKEFIKLNKKVLLDYWDYKIITTEMIERLEPIGINH